MTLSTLAVALAAQALPAPGAVQWEEVARDGAGRYAIDPASIVREGDRVRFLMRATGAQANADGTSAAVVRYLIDCRRRTSAVLAVDAYRGDAFAYSRETDEDELVMLPIAGAGGEAQLQRRACGG
ncbi:MAG TPA: surface-adhesin E family protein [Allosphingosinicella sp.]|nr:surface-adhesin E family protein [Allosphingosinicella sp.]